MSAGASLLHAAHRITRNYLHATAHKRSRAAGTLPDVGVVARCDLRIRDVP